ncbi:MAG: Crp/Fnr family transcriptional regulator [Saprospiraceae bacterium]|nr:Crp/Fnr family transcriptional regulator [Saprospiraceae bacterium]
MEEQYDLHALVKQHFPQITDNALIDSIVAEGRLMEFPAGQVIMDFGSYVRMVPLVVKGRVKVIREDDAGNELFLYYLEEGETCSMSFTCCMMNKRSEIRTVAEEDTLLIGIPIRFMDAWMDRFQSWKNFVMTSYDQRFQELVRTLDSIAFKKMDERLLEYLDKKRAGSADGVIRATHQEIARDLNASREAISRLLKTLERDGLVTLGRNEIAFTS